ncbi:MAG: sugar ABC transporter ATP-binding protein [Sulfobacillus thermosulfidooxidans]|uniref:Sugar ABC transporter ATP-binding protein n=1 Tax=Sulfobacillus thermosulfidooxidans TaxID=28034 RepID=A0A2T2WRF4_SULTH|nr:MAG: sugar ABC transporter ATP-binding protein [Sulfobacillus thermosulfidooxidans]
MSSQNSTIPVLELQNLSKSYGTIQAVKNANLSIKQGEVMALVGDNGAGKSTLVKMISGAVQPSSGRILLDGQNVTIKGPLDGRNLGIETVYQDLALAPHLSVLQNMFLGREIIKQGLLGRLFGTLDKRAMKEVAEKELNKLKIHIKSLTQPVSDLSGGQRQAVAVARSAVWGSRLLILDEPTNHLGVHEVAMVLDLIRQVRNSGVSVLYITHTIPHVFEVADRIAVMYLGSISVVLDSKNTNMDEVVGYITGTKVSA